MTCAPAVTDSCVADGNLSATVDHYGTRKDLCPTGGAP